MGAIYRNVSESKHTGLKQMDDCQQEVSDKLLQKLTLAQNFRGCGRIEN